jgi:hypothetical protein
MLTRVRERGAEVEIKDGSRIVNATWRVLRGVKIDDGSFEAEWYQSADTETELSQRSAEKLRRAVMLAGFRIFHQQTHSNI